VGSVGVPEASSMKLLGGLLLSLLTGRVYEPGDLPAIGLSTTSCGDFERA
jgi:hypothetical protein